MSSTPQRLTAEALTAELAKLPALSTTVAVHLDPVRIAVARAIATGQSAEQIASDLGLPAAWNSIDFSKPPSVFAAKATAVKAADIAAPVKPATPSATPPATPTAKTAPPDWAAKIVPLALAGTQTTRVVVLDREPTALAGLERPAWARALSPSATYGPISITSAANAVTIQRWITIFNFSETVEFTRGGVPLCVLPVSILHFRGTNTASGGSILSGSAWLGLTPFNTTAPANSFAGLTIHSGSLSCDQAFTIGTTIAIPTGATLTLSLVPAPSPAGPLNFPAQVQAPGTITVTFPPTGAATISFDSCSATIYNSSVTAASATLPATYNSQLMTFYIAGHASTASFAPQAGGGGIAEIAGSAPILTAGWALFVSESTTPLTLGTAADSGHFVVAFGAGISAQWKGLAKPEPAAIGAIVAQNNSILLYTFSGEAPNTVVEQVFNLWPDQDSNNNTPCKLVAGRVAGQLMIYARSGSFELVELGAALAALLDRPVYATGARMPAVFAEALIALSHSNAGNRLAVYSALAAPNTTVFPMALDNAFLDVSVPLAIFLEAKADANFNVTSGFLLLTMGYLLVELFLPDPYTGGLLGADTGPTDGPGRVAGNGLTPTTTAGYLIGEVGWSPTFKPQLRLFDSAHPHPAIPPATEASDAPVVSAAQLNAARLLTEQAKIVPDDVVPPPPSTAFPGTIDGAVLLDLSTRASQLGVEVTLGRYNTQYTIDGLSVRGPAVFLPLTTLPSIAWEPMYDHAVVTPGVDPNQLLHPPGDGPLPQVRSLSATLIPISPLQTFANLLAAGPGGFEANFTLPFGITGELASSAVTGTLLPNLALVQPSFPANGTPTGSVYTGAWQLSFSAPDPTKPDPVMAGRTYLRSANDNPAAPTYSYGEQVMGPDVADIFASRFNAPNGGVPLLRYDLTGYGASTFSEWTNTNPAPTDVIKSFFHVLIGRTSHEVIQVQSILCPWGIKVVRTITIDRLASGNVRRYDSGWQPASDGLFKFPTAMGITAQQVHAGVSSGVINVTNITQIGLPVSTPGTADSPAPTPPPAPPPAAGIPVQAVTFDANVIIQPQHKVMKGGIKATDLTGGLHTCVPSKGITGYIPLQYGYHLSLTDMVNFAPLAAGSGGPIDATLNMAGANSIVRLISFDATPVLDTSVSNSIGIIGSVRGLPKLSSDGAWTLAARKQSPTSAPVALAPNVGAPVVQPNSSGGTTPGNLVHFADPADIFRLAPSAPALPQTLYGFLQATGTQSNFLSRPILTVGSQNLTLGDALNVAHAGALLGAISSFPGIANCLNFLNSALTNPIVNQLENATLQTTQNLQLTTAVRQKPVPLITTSVADVNLYFYWKGDDPTVPPNPATVVISLGQPTDPSWSLDVNRVALGLVIPALSSDPVMWLQGGFHADADTTPAFPNLKVVFDGPLSALTTFFTVLEDIASVLSPGEGGADESASGGPGLNVHFSGGTLSVTDNFDIPAIPLGPGTIDNVSLDISATLNILALNIGFLVSIGTPDTPCHWIVDPLAGTVCIQAGVQNNAVDILIEGGIGVGLSIDLGIASGSASITIAVQLTINPPIIKLMLLLTGQAQVDVLGGLASAAITLTAGLGFSINTSNADIDVIGTASVGIHISICWVISISWSGSWTFEKQLPLTQVA